MSKHVIRSLMNINLSTISHLKIITKSFSQVFQFYFSPPQRLMVILITQKNNKIAIVKFCLQIARNCDQSRANFQFSKFKVQGLDIETLLGAEGPQQGPKGPQPSAGARRKGAQCPELLVCNIAMKKLENEKVMEHYDILFSY